jgi:hypothetical protein
VTVFGFIAAEKTTHSVKTMCRLLGVSRSGFHAWERRGPSARALADQALTRRIMAFVFRGTFAAPGTVTVTSGNARVGKGGFIGEAVAFDLSGARIVGADTNGDQAVDLLDVKDGDRVLVQARLPKGTS